MSNQDLHLESDEAEWNWIQPHLERDAVIVVKTPLTLERAGKAMAQNETEEVQSWVQQELISKPNSEQIQKWNGNPSQKFLCLVIQPFVLIQEIMLQ